MIKNSYKIMPFKILIIFVLLLLVFTTFSCTQADKGSFSGQVLRDGNPSRGSVRILDPETMAPLGETALSNNGKFFFKDIPTGEWLIVLTTRTGGVIGNYHYIKVKGMASTKEVIFDVSEEDPKAEELLAKFSSDETNTEGDL